MYLLVVSLPGMTLDAAVHHANTMLEALAGAADPGRAFPGRDKDRHTILDVLDWLWDAIAQPVLTALGHTTTPAPAARGRGRGGAVRPIHLVHIHLERGLLFMMNDATLVLARRGLGVVETEFGKALGGGLYEFRRRWSAAEATTVRTRRILLRVSFCTPVAGSSCC